MSRARTLSTMAVVFFLGFLSMGFQLVASRLLAPFFGSSIIVWAFLISTFLAAFSIGSMLGGWVSRLPARPKRIWVRGIVAGTVGGFSFTALFGRPFLDVVEPAFESLAAGLLVSCGALFLIPVVMLSATGPVIIETIARAGTAAGLASGLVYGISTAGNICGVMGVAFLLIPNFRISRLLIAWAVLAVLCMVYLAARILSAGGERVSARARSSRLVFGTRAVAHATVTAADAFGDRPAPIPFQGPATELRPYPEGSDLGSLANASGAAPLSRDRSSPARRR